MSTRDVPWLNAEVERLRAELEQARKERDDARANASAEAQEANDQHAEAQRYRDALERIEAIAEPGEIQDIASDALAGDK